MEPLEHDPAITDPVIIDAFLVLRDESPGAAERLHAALRAEGLVGVVGRDEHLGLVSCWLRAGEDGLLLRASATGLEPGLTVEVVAARLSRSLDAAVFVDRSELRAPEDPDAYVEVALPGFDAAAAVQERRATAAAEPRVVSLVSLDAEGIRPRLPELAQGIGARAVLVPAGGQALIARESGTIPPWWRATMPVVSIVAEPTIVALHVHLRARMGVPELAWGAVWMAPQLAVQGPDAHPDVRVAEARLRERDPIEPPEEAVAQALGWDERTVAALLAIPADDRPSADTIVDAIGAPAAMARIAEGGDPMQEPGAVAYEPTGMGATLADAMILASRPKGDTAWSRYERWWWRHPGFSTAVGAGLLVLVAVLAVAATIGDSWSWWRAIVCAVGVLNGVSLLGSAALARRERRQQAASSPR